MKGLVLLFSSIKVSRRQACGLAKGRWGRMHCNWRAIIFHTLFDAILSDKFAGQVLGTSSTESCFTLGIQFPFQQQAMLKLGPQRAITMDAMVGTNGLGVRVSMPLTMEIHCSLLLLSVYFMLAPGSLEGSIYNHQDWLHNVGEAMVATAGVTMSLAENCLLNPGFSVMQFHFHTLMVFDDHKNGIPVAWVITSSGTQRDVASGRLTSNGTCGRWTPISSHHASWCMTAQEQKPMQSGEGRCAQQIAARVKAA